MEIDELAVTGHAVDGETSSHDVNRKRKARRTGGCPDKARATLAVLVNDEIRAVDGGNAIDRSTKTAVESAERRKAASIRPDKRGILVALRAAGLHSVEM